MSILDKYRAFHRWGSQFIRVEAHVGMGFFFPTVAGIWGIKPMGIVLGLMVAVIAVKEVLDDKTGKGPYSVSDLLSWAVGGFMAVGVYWLGRWM